MTFRHTNHVTGAATAAAERTFLDAADFCAVSRSIDEFGDFIHQREVMLVAEYVETPPRLDLRRAQTEEEVVFAFRRRLHELFLNCSEGGWA